MDQYNVLDANLHEPPAEMETFIKKVKEITLSKLRICHEKKTWFL